MVTNPRNILITGASGGLGAAMALTYAQPGRTLFLGGRHLERLKRVEDHAKVFGAQIVIKQVDVTDRAAMRQWIEEADQEKKLDLVIANAGISAGTGGDGETPAQRTSIFETNVQGVFNTIDPILPLMQERHRGQIAIMASQASFLGLPTAPSYAASKAAVRIYGEALRVAMAPHGVEINVICPGFVKTPLTDVNQFKMPFLMTADQAARLIHAGLLGNRSRISFPWQMSLAIGLANLLPLTLRDQIMLRLPVKPAQES